MKFKIDIVAYFCWKKNFLPLISACILLLFSTTNQAQNELKTISEELSVNESIYIQTNTTTLVTGESLLYKLFTLNSNNTQIRNLSKIAYVTLFNKEGKNVVTQKVEVKDGIATGDIFIPATIPTGVYGLKAYTNWMLNDKNRIITNKKIVVINPFEKPNFEIKKNNLENLKPEVASEIKTDFIQLDKKTFSTREKVQLNFSDLAKNSKSNLSISVRKRNDLPIVSNLNIQNSLNQIQQNPTKKQSNPTYIPEVFGETISGFIKSKDAGISNANKTVILSLEGKSFSDKITSTDSEGKFAFVLEKQYPTSKMYLQVLDQEKSMVEIKLNDTKYLESNELIVDEIPNWSPNLKKPIEERSIAIQIENAYYFKKQDSLSSIYNYKPFFENLGKEYNLDDFTRFPKVRETLIEVISEVYVVQNRNNYFLKVKNYDPTNQNTFPTMVLFDGLYIQNIKSLLDSKSEHIQKIKFIPGYFYLGSKIFDGVVSFETKSGNFDVSTDSFAQKQELTRPIISKKAFQPNYSAENKKEWSNIPDYRYQLLWLPEVNQKAENVQFFTSDIVGIFEIVLEGITQDGKSIYEYQTFEVK